MTTDTYDFVGGEGNAPGQSDAFLSLTKDFKLHSHRFILSPSQWQTCEKYAELAWYLIDFASENMESVPEHESGVYSLVISPDVANHPACSYLMYVGKAERGFRRRFGEYLAEERRLIRPKLHLVLTTWKGYVRFCYAPISEAGRISEVERALIAAFVPPCNSVFPGVIGRAVSAFRNA